MGNSSKFTFTADAHTFNFLLEGGYTYLVVATEGCAAGLGRAALAWATRPVVQVQPVSDESSNIVLRVCVGTGPGGRSPTHTWRR